MGAPYFYDVPVTAGYSIPLFLGPFRDPPGCHPQPLRIEHPHLVSQLALFLAEKRVQSLPRWDLMQPLRIALWPTTNSPTICDVVASLIPFPRPRRIRSMHLFKVLADLRLPYRSTTLSLDTSISYLPIPTSPQFGCPAIFQRPPTPHWSVDIGASPLGDQ